MRNCWSMWCICQQVLALMHFLSMQFSLLPVGILILLYFWFVLESNFVVKKADASESGTITKVVIHYDPEAEKPSESNYFLWNYRYIQSKYCCPHYLYKNEIHPLLMYCILWYFPIDKKFEGLSQFFHVIVWLLIMFCFSLLFLGYRRRINEISRVSGKRQYCRWRDITEVTDQLLQCIDFESASRH